MVHVDRLDGLSPRENDGVILVVGLTLSHQDFPGELSRATEGKRNIPRKVGKLGYTYTHTPRGEGGGKSHGNRRINLKEYARFTSHRQEQIEALNIPL